MNKFWLIQLMLKRKVLGNCMSPLLGGETVPVCTPVSSTNESRRVYHAPRAPGPSQKVVRPPTPPQLSSQEVGQEPKLVLQRTPWTVRPLWRKDLVPPSRCV